MFKIGPLVHLPPRHQRSQKGLQKCLGHLSGPVARLLECRAGRGFKASYPQQMGDCPHFSNLSLQCQQ
eukprot:6490647-Amphidinium_carterae.1